MAVKETKVQEHQSAQDEVNCAYCHNPDTWDTGGGKLASVEDISREIEKYVAYYRSSGDGITVTGILFPGGFFI